MQPSFVVPHPVSELKGSSSGDYTRHYYYNSLELLLFLYAKDLYRDEYK